MLKSIPNEKAYRAWKAKEAKKANSENIKNETVDGNYRDVEPETTELDKTERGPLQDRPQAESFETTGIKELDIIKKRVLAIESNPSEAPPLSEIDNEIADLQNNLYKGYVTKDGKLQQV